MNPVAYFTLSETGWLFGKEYFIEICCAIVWWCWNSMWCTCYPYFVFILENCITKSISYCATLAMKWLPGLKFCNQQLISSRWVTNLHKQEKMVGCCNIFRLKSGRTSHHSEVYIDWNQQLNLYPECCRIDYQWRRWCCFALKVAYVAPSLLS